MRWRKATWALLIWTGLAILFMYLITQAAGKVNEDCVPTSSQDLCEATTAIAGGVWFMIIFFLWFVGFIVLSIIWFMSRPARRLCPACGTQAKKGVFICTRCGYDFRIAAAPQVPPPIGPPAGWGQPQQGPPSSWSQPQQGPPSGWGQPQQGPPSTWNQPAQPQAGPPPDWGQPAPGDPADPSRYQGPR